MRTSQIISITLPPEMLTRAVALAKKENRTMSELVREALRHYERQRCRMAGGGRRVERPRSGVLPR